MSQPGGNWFLLARHTVGKKEAIKNNKAPDAFILKLPVSSRMVVLVRMVWFAKCQRRPFEIKN